MIAAGNPGSMPATADPPARCPDPDDVRRRALLRAAEGLAQVGSWDFVPSEDRLEWSENLFRIFGLEPDEIAPTPEYVYAQTHPDDRDRVEREVAELVSSGELRPLNYRIVRPDGGLRHVRATLTVAEQRDGLPYRMVGWVQDVTEQRRAEREIAAHNAVAQSLAAWDSLESGAHGLLARLADAMDLVAGVLWIPRRDVLVARVLWHSGLVELPEFLAATRRATRPRGVGVAGRAWERREPINQLGPIDAPETARQVAARSEGLRGAVAIPAVHDGEVLAVVELASREETELTQRLMRSLTAISSELGHFLARRRGELGDPVLTARELDVIRLTAQGRSARATAAELHVSPATVRTHLENIYGKLGVGDKAAAVAIALRQGLID
jgi:PAS domain S-box-containing protein